MYGGSFVDCDNNLPDCGLQSDSVLLDHTERNSLHILFAFFFLQVI